MKMKIEIVYLQKSHQPKGAAGRGQKQHRNQRAARFAYEITSTEAEHTCEMATAATVILYNCSTG